VAVVRPEWYQEAAAHCIQCGFCQATCPLYQQVKVATAVARGHINLFSALVEGAVPPGWAAEKRLEMCLLCRRCAASCPSGVPTDDVIVAARQYLVEKGRYPYLKRVLVRGVLGRPGNRVPLLGGARLAQVLFFGSSVGDFRRARVRLPQPLRHVPPLPGGTFRDRMPQMIPPRTARARGRVAYFTGCFTNLVDHRVGRSVVKVMTGAGLEVAIPAGQGCCGLPALAAGDVERGLGMLAATVRTLAGSSADAVVVDCSSCEMMLKEKGSHLLTPYDEEAAELARTLAPRVYEVCELLADPSGLACPSGSGPRDEGVLSRAGTSGPLRVTYHVPCHYTWGRQEVRDAPRTVLRDLPGVEWVELADAEACCGAGGLFFVSNHAVAAAIRSLKIKDIRATGARVLVSPCPVCRFWLGAGSAAEQLDLKVRHPVELLAMAYLRRGEQE